MYQTNPEYPKCERCESQMNPIWFTEEEYKVYDGCRYKTGRKRRNVSHFECPNCFQKAAVDDTFAKEWHNS